MIAQFDIEPACRDFRHADGAHFSQDAIPQSNGFAGGRRLRLRADHVRDSGARGADRTRIRRRDRELCGCRDDPTRPALVKDILLSHGPLEDLLAWLMTYLTGTQDFSRARLIVVALALAACLAVATSPALGRGYTARLWAAALFLAPLSALWFVHPLHMLIYHALTGYLVTILLAQLVLPAIAGVRIGTMGAFISGASSVLAVTSTYPMVVPVGLCVAAAGVALSAYAGWLALRRVLLGTRGRRRHRSPAGRAVDHAIRRLGRAVCIHIYFNLFVYARIVGYSPWDAFHGVIFSLTPAMRAHSFAVCLGALGLLGAWRRHGSGRASRAIGLGLTGAAILMLNPTGSPAFPDVAQMIACFGLMAVALGARLGETHGVRLVGALISALAVVVAGEAVAHTALISPHGMLRSQAPIAILRPNPKDPIVVEIQRLVHPGETILALPFMPAYCITAQRLPASADIYYLPFQAEYDRAPILGRVVDLCGDIERVRPPVILLMEAPVSIWGHLEIQTVPSRRSWHGTTRLCRISRRLCRTSWSFLSAEIVFRKAYPD